MKIYGLTGNIGTGKSTVAKILKNLGANIIDADQIARDVVKPSKPAWNQIVDHFGKEILNPDSTINRKKLGEIVFRDKSKREELNKITHPYILEEIKSWVSESKKTGRPVSFIEAALLKQDSKLGNMLDGVIAVTADRKKQIERIKKRDQITESEAQSRIRSQVMNSEKIEGADFVIINNSNIEELEKEVSHLWNKITGF